MRRVLLVAAAVLLGLPAVASAAATPGAAGIGDPYYPNAGNGGYDVAHYGLDLSYQPSSNRLTGVATITARATQDLSTFNLDLEGLTVSAITVNGAARHVAPRRRRAGHRPGGRPAQRRRLHDRDQLPRRAGHARQRPARARSPASCTPTTAR